MSDRQRKMKELRAARLERVRVAKSRTRELGTDGSFAILVHGEESRVDLRNCEPRALWFSEYELLESHIRIHRHSSLQNQEWQIYTYSDVWAASDRSLSEVLGIVKEMQASDLLEAMLNSNSHVRDQMENGTMGVGIPHTASRNRREETLNPPQTGSD